MKLSNNKLSLKIIILFSISLLAFYFLNLYTHIASDDYTYKYIFDRNGYGGIRCESFSDIITTMYNHYVSIYGRSLHVGLMQLISMSDNKLWFNIANTLVFGLFQFLILKRSIKLNIRSEYQYLLLIMFLWFLIPDPKDTLLWITGSVGYMWTIIIVLLFLDFFDRINLKNFQVNNKYLPLIIIFGFLAGFTHEIFSVGISGALCIELLKNFKKYKISSLILIFGFLLGTFIMVIAPSNLNKFIDVNASTETYSIFYMILKRCYHFILSTKHSIAFWIMIVIFSVLFVKDRNGLKKVYREHELLLHSIFITLAFIFFVGRFDDRGRLYFGISVFSIIIIFSVLHKYYKLFFNNKNRIIYVILLIFVIIEYTQVVSELRVNKIIIDKEEEYWFKSDDIVFEKIEENKNRFSYPGFYFSDGYSYHNTFMKWYYGKEFMMFIPSDLYQNVYKSNKYLVDKNLLSTKSLKKSSEGIKLYKTPNNNFLVYKLADSISENIKEGAHVKYKSNKVIKKNKMSYVNKVESFLGVNQVSNITTKTADCFVLPTAHGKYLILNSPSAIPFENLEEIIIYPSKNDTIPILSF